MSESHTTAPVADPSLAGRWAPGWYSDPQKDGGLRYWDGATWTEHTSGVHATPPPQPVATKTPMKPSTPAKPPARPASGFFGWVARNPKASFWSTLGVALLVGIGVGAASSQSDSKPSTSSSADPSQLADIQNQLHSVQSDLSDREGELKATKAKLADTRDELSDARAETRDANKAVAKAKKKARAPKPAATPSGSSPSGGATKSFSGNGSKSLGTITIARDSVLKWTNDGDIFQMWDDEFAFNVNSQGHSGDTALSPGTYKDVTVNAIGNWTLQIVPR